MPKSVLPLGITCASLATLAAGLHLNLYLLIAAGVMGLTAAAWLATES